MATPPPDDGWPEPTYLTITRHTDGDWSHVWEYEDGWQSPRIYTPRGYSYQIVDLLADKLNPSEEDEENRRGPTVVRWRHE